MGGTVVAESPAGQGATFRVRLPNIPISARLPVSEQLPADRDGDFNELEPATLLVVDDNEENRQLIASMFAGSDHKLEFGSDGFQAVSKARALRPDLILLDIRMPGLDGREASTHIRKLPGLETIPIIAVTASTMLEDQGDLEAKFNAHLRKPFSKHELFAEVANFLPRRAKTSLPPEAGGTASATAADATALAPAPPELGAELHRLLAEEWPAIRDNLAINETKSFAGKLETLAQRWPCPALLDYAQAMAHHAEVYEVVELEKLVNQLPELVKRLSGPAPA